MPRNKNRQAGPIRRTVVASNAGAGPESTVGNNPALRTLTTVNMRVGSTKKNRRPSTDKGGNGYWRTVSQNHRDIAGSDPRWDATASTHA